MTNPSVFLLFGAPGSDKSESCILLDEISEGNLQVLQKETTRPPRKLDSHEIKSVNTISKDCDLRYSQYGYDYGFSSKLIWNSLKNGNSMVVIVNDIRTIKILNKKFGSLSKNIYIHSNIDKTHLTKILKTRYPTASNDFLQKDIEKRIEKIKTIHRKYIENTYLFHSTIINIYNEDDKSKIHLRNQLQQIYHKNIVNNFFLGSTSRIIIVAGASFSGKDALVNAMTLIEPTKTLLYPKGTTRPKNKKDLDELFHFKELPNNYDIRYNKNSYTYGLSIEDIWSNLSKQKVVLIVLSDLEAILKLKKEFNSICTILYLHANMDEEEMKEAKKEMGNNEFEKRCNSIKELSKTYMENINIFNHTLLNTSETEDLYDQAFNILDFYLD